MPVRPRLMTLRTRTTAAVLLVAVVVLGVCHAVLVRWTDATYHSEARSRVQALAEGVAAIAEIPVVAGDAAELERLASLMLANPRVDFAVVRGPDGSILASASKPGVSIPSHADGGEYQIGHAAVTRAPAGGLNVFGDLESAPVGAGTSPGDVVAWINVGFSRATIAREVARSQRTPRVVIFAGCLVIGGMIWVVAGAWTRRLDRLVSAADGLARGDTDHALDESRRDEIGSLSRAFERMRRAVCERDADLRRLNATLQDQVRERTRDLEAALAQAEAANRAKSDFLANMSHEIRTPMTAILGFAEVLSDEALPPAVRADAGRTIVRSGGHLLQVINDILDLSKIEAGQMSVESVPTQVAQIIEDVASCMRPIASEKGLPLEVLYETPIPRQITSDPTRIRQILFNLVSNAIKFTSAGSVSIGVACQPESDTLTLRVTDTGMGIAPEQIDRLFRPFAQADSSMSRRFGGTGLGLVIARRLAEILGGTLEVRSELQKGSTFTAVIAAPGCLGAPMVTGAVVEAPGATASSGSSDLVGLRVLLAEDGIENQRLLLHHLRKAGAEAHLAGNGRLALEALARARAAGTPFHVVLLDMQMPEVDGYAVATATRQAGDRTPLVALTAHALSGDREKCLAAGCDDYLTKPIERAPLIETCRRWGRAARRPAA